MFLDPDQFIDRHSFFWGVWEPDETRVVMQLLRSGDTFVDIGANAGYFSLLASRLVGPSGRVYAFEPVPPTVDKLRRNIDFGGAANIIVCPCAASGEAGLVSINRKGVGDVSGQNTMRPDTTPADHWEVRAARIDDVVPAQEAIRLMKIDVEGAELLALKGAERHLRSPSAPALLCEVTDSYLRELKGSADELWRYLADLGYRFIHDCHNGRLSPIHAEALSTEFQMNVLLTKQPLESLLPPGQR
jgi:FkbM family methyltransferase